MKKPGDTNPASPQTPASAAEQQMVQLRKNLKAQVAQLKQSVFNIQQESLKQLQKEVDRAFGNLATDSASQISKQDKDIQEQMMKGMTGEAGGDQPEAAAAGSASSTPSASTLIDGGKNAMKIARQMAADAMKASQTKVEEALSQTTGALNTATNAPNTNDNNHG